MCEKSCCWRIAPIWKWCHLGGVGGREGGLTGGGGGGWVYCYECNKKRGLYYLKNVFLCMRSLPPHPTNWPPHQTRNIVLSTRLLEFNVGGSPKKLTVFAIQNNSAQHVYIYMYMFRHSLIQQMRSNKSNNCWSLGRMCVCCVWIYSHCR